MKKIYILLLFCLVMLSGCNKEIPEIQKVTSYEALDELIARDSVLKYDIRETSLCEEGHIPTFMCMGANEMTTERIEELIRNIKILYPKKDKYMIIIDSDNINSLQILEALHNDGYKNLFYFDGGYDNYVSQKGSSFVPEVGCNC